MKRFAVILVLSCALLARVHAETLGRDVEVTPVPGWASVDPLAPGQPVPPYPVLKFTPKDGRNAAVLISLLPANVPGYEVTDLASLKAFNIVASRPYLPSPDARPTITELQIPDGLGVAITNEDPALIGKAPPPGEYKIATTVSLLLGGKTLLHCTVFYDEKNSEDFQEAMKLLLSATVRVPSPAI
jgi:hypothetical protein